jgi:hypothetical protein
MVDEFPGLSAYCMTIWSALASPTRSYHFLVGGQIKIFEHKVSEAELINYTFRSTVLIGLDVFASSMLQWLTRRLARN